MVTLSEGFEYAKENTIRDTLRHTRETQRPSYAVNLRGRRDLVLARVKTSPSLLSVAQKVGPLELVNADSGVTLLELPPGPREVMLAVPPGIYLVRRRLERVNLVREVLVVAGAKSRIAEEQLTLVGSDRLAVTGPEQTSFMASVRSPALVARPTTLRRPPERSVSRWISGGAYATGLLAVLGTLTTLKLMENVRYYDRSLDRYRRFPCANQPAVTTCAQGGSVQLGALTEADLSHVKHLKAQGNRFEDYSFAFMVATGVSVVASGTLSYLWWRGTRPAPALTHRTASLELLPALGPNHQGMSALVRF